MISVIHQIEETNLEQGIVKNKYIPLDEVRVKNADDNLRLKRKTPVVSSQKYTLENCMRLKRI